MVEPNVIRRKSTFTEARKEEIFKADPMKLSWKNVSYEVDIKYSKREMKEKNLTDSHYSKTILRDQAGYINSGETLFIMGSSGAGKTTLLNVLCDRITKSKRARVSGEITVNDTYPVTQKDFGKYGAYVMQDDVLFQTLTCEEALRFAAQLKLGLKGDELEDKVNLTLESLGLLKCRKTLIGSQLIKGLSGGERKRTAIGVELINNPSIIFLDEPTSGLDSFTANKIVKLLVDQAKLGKTVIATIHQPSSSTYELFDRLLLLMDGNTIYQGKAHEASAHFKAIGYECPPFHNPADYFLKEFYVPFNRKQADDDKLEAVVKGYNDQIRPKMMDEDQALQLKGVTKESLEEQSHHVAFCKELILLLARTGKNLIRNPQASRVRIMQTIIICILIILVYWDMGTDEDGINGKAGYSFFLSINQVMTALFSVLLTFLSERPVFLREYANKMYGIWPYFISKSIVEIPFQACIPLFVACVTYFAVGMTADADRFFLHALVLILDVFCATSFGFFVGCAVTNESAANSLVSLMMLPFILFGGFFVNLGDVYVWLRWIQYISPIRYSTEALIRIEFEDNDKYSSKPYESLGFDIGLTNCIIVLAALAVVFRILALVFLKLTVSKVQ